MEAGQVEAPVAPYDRAPSFIESGVH
ncbi:TPA: hypothetical protein ANIA_11443 [Aspergillus nidulans FGSC A4]|uniref:Uncharacterized protein n=1 Tax=Emericella nidulans (strain FGSC A4 / ATCC 38163 / CBS 112.46 / NRRL 194 / M139) TaxID=227321 RepID=C8V7V4_EMENI|nr:TPA: hypothetical protein ANIA_11443 [Aspergillus nidulans FGSC A4]